MACGGVNYGCRQGGGRSWWAAELRRDRRAGAARTLIRRYDARVPRRIVDGDGSGGTLAAVGAGGIAPSEGATALAAVLVRTHQVPGGGVRAKAWNASGVLQATTWLCQACGIAWPPAMATCGRCGARSGAAAHHKSYLCNSHRTCHSRRPKWHRSS